jgi:hypothetical protein
MALKRRIGVSQGRLLPIKTEYKSHRKKRAAKWWMINEYQ